MFSCSEAKPETFKHHCFYFGNGAILQCSTRWSKIHTIVLGNLLQYNYQQQYIESMRKCGPHQVLTSLYFKSCPIIYIPNIGSGITGAIEVSTGLRSQWIIFSLCSICRHLRRAWANRRMRARLKPWKLFFLMSSYKFTLWKETKCDSWLVQNAVET